MKNMIEISDLTAFIKLITSDLGVDYLLLYRGQPEDKPLLPGIARPQMNWNKDVLAIEQELIDEFKKRSRPFLKDRIDSEWDWLALAQHYGLATRLLDWTTNPLAALWFTVKDPAKNSNSGVVWFLEVERQRIVTSQEMEKLSPYDAGTYTRIFQPNHITARITAQNGWFTTHTPNKKKKYVPLENNDKYSRNLVKILIPSNKFASIRRDLDDCGINASAIFPGLEGVAQNIVWKNRELSDERL